LDLVRAFTYFQEDENWTNKIPVTVVIGIIPIVNLAVFGWALDLIRNMLDGVPNPTPDWNDIGTQFVDRWVRGLILAIVGFIYFLPMLIVAGIVNGVFLSIALGSRGGFGVVSLAGLCITVISLIYFAIVWLPLSIAIMRYARTRDFNNFLQIARNFKLAMDNLNTMVMLAVLIFIVGLIVGLLGNIPCIGFLISLLAAPFTAIVEGHLIGQAAIEIAAKTRGSGTA